MLTRQTSTSRKNSFELPGINFPLCSAFLPTIHEGELCYKLNVNDTSGEGKKNSLLLLFDYSKERSLHTLDQKDDSSKVLLNYDREFEREEIESAKIHLNTLSGYTGFGEGVYQIKGVKRMKSKEDFLKMPLKERNCNNELYEDCWTRSLLEECNCVPWDVPGFQVRTCLKPNNEKYRRTCKNATSKAEIALHANTSTVALSIV